MPNVISNLRNLFSVRSRAGRRSAPGASATGTRRLLGLQQLEHRNMFAVVHLSGQEQLLLELVNRQRANPTAEAARYGIDLNKDLAPDKISAEPKQPVAPNLHLRNSARLHADNMLERDFFGHVDPKTGTTPSDRARAAGYPAGAGENISWRGESRPLQKTVETYNVHEDLFRSEGHRVNTMTPHYRELGTGVRFGQFRTENDDGILRSFFSIMAAENFGNRGGNAFITGVAFNDNAQQNNFYEVSEAIAGATIRATDEAGTVFSTETSSSGGYTLPVPDGVYSVTASGSGLVSATFENIVIDGVNQKVDFNARNRGFSAISGRVFEDLNGDGVRDANETFLADQTINLGNNYEGYRDAVFATATTDSQGFFQFNNLAPEPYRVFVDLPRNRLSTTPEDDGVYTIDLRSSQRVATLEFGVAPINEPPTAVDDRANTFERVSVVIDVAANDTDDGMIDRSSIEITEEAKFGRARIDQATNNVIYVPNDDHTGWDVFGYTIRDEFGAVSNQARVDIKTDMGVGAVWQNPVERMDVNNDSLLSPIDALLVINELIDGGARRLTQVDRIPPPYIDVNGDGSVSAIDALQILNELNSRNAAGSALAATANTNAEGTDSSSDTASSDTIERANSLRFSSEFAASVDTFWEYGEIDRQKKTLSLPDTPEYV